jgi:hypothetical protein
MGGGRLWKRDGIWHFVRRVPQQYAEHDGRVIVRQSTGIPVVNDPRAIHARRVAEAMDESLETYWRGLANGGIDLVMAEYEKARAAAKRLGVSPPVTDKAERTIAELMQRIELLQQGDRIKQRDVVQGLLDEAPAPAITFRQCAEQYIDAHKAGWSNAKHARQWPSSLAQYALYDHRRRAGVAVIRQARHAFDLPGARPDLAAEAGYGITGAGQDREGAELGESQGLPGR